MVLNILRVSHCIAKFEGITWYKQFDVSHGIKHFEGITRVIKLKKIRWTKEKNTTNNSRQINSILMIEHHELATNSSVPELVHCELIYII